MSDERPCYGPPMLLVRILTKNGTQIKNKYMKVWYSKKRE